jgi:orotate phosphoribosyltransferase-like protein
VVQRQEGGKEGARMSWVLNILIGVLALILIALVVVRLRLKKRLQSIDGVVGITTHGAYTGKVIGGEFTKVYQNKKEK